MHGQPEAVRALAREVAGLAAAARSGAAEVQRTRGVEWASAAADRYRATLAEEVALVRSCAEELDAAVRALHEHADAVEHRQAQIRAAERFVSGLVDDARRRLADAVDDVDDAATAGARWVVDQARRVPSPGSLDWLSFAGRLGF